MFYILMVLFLFIQDPLYAQEAASCRILKDDTKTLELIYQTVDGSQKCNEYQPLQMAVNRIQDHFKLIFKQNPHWSEFEEIALNFNQVLQSMRGCQKIEASNGLLSLLDKSKLAFQNYCSENI